MNLLKNLFSKKLNGEALARSAKVEEFALIELLASFREGAAVHKPLTQQRWNRLLARGSGLDYDQQLEKFVEAGWLAPTTTANGKSGYRVTETGAPFVALYDERIAKERSEIMPKVRAALADRDTGEALELRRQYEDRQPLGEATWTGPEPQLSHSALTRRVLFLDHWLLDGLSEETVDWLKLYAAEQHMWGTYWRVAAEEIPAAVRSELASNEVSGGMTGEEAAYWRAYQLALYVDNQETWQRCSGGDHVRRIRIVWYEGADLPDENTGPGQPCSQCADLLGTEYLVKRVPELPPKACTSTQGCLCRYEPVLESYEQDE